MRSQWLMLEEKEMKTLIRSCGYQMDIRSWISDHEYQIMDRSRHTISNFWTMKKLNIRQSMNSCLRNSLKLRSFFYEVKMLISTNEHLEPIIGGLFILQYANGDCCSCTTISFKSSVMYINLKSWKWTHTDLSNHLLKRTYMTIPNQTRELPAKNEKKRLQKLFHGSCKS